MSSRRDFLVNVGRTLGAAAVLAGPVAQVAAGVRPVAPGTGRPADSLEKWLLATGHGTLEPQLAEEVRRQIR